MEISKDTNAISVFVLFIKPYTYFEFFDGILMRMIQIVEYSQSRKTALLRHRITRIEIAKQHANETKQHS